MRIRVCIKTSVRPRMIIIRNRLFKSISLLGDGLYYDTKEVVNGRIYPGDIRPLSELLKI